MSDKKPVFVCIYGYNLDIPTYEKLLEVQAELAALNPPQEMLIIPPNEDQVENLTVEDIETEMETYFGEGGIYEDRDYTAYLICHGDIEKSEKDKTLSLTLGKNTGTHIEDIYDILNIYEGNNGLMIGACKGEAALFSQIILDHELSNIKHIVADCYFDNVSWQNDTGRFVSALLDFAAKGLPFTVENLHKVYLANLTSMMSTVEFQREKYTDRNGHTVFLEDTEKKLESLIEDGIDPEKLAKAKENIVPDFLTEKTFNKIVNVINAETGLKSLKAYYKELEKYQYYGPALLIASEVISENNDYIDTKFLELYRKAPTGYINESFKTGFLELDKKDKIKFLKEYDRLFAFRSIAYRRDYDFFLEALDNDVEALHDIIRFEVDTLLDAYHFLNEERDILFYSPDWMKAYNKEESIQVLKDAMDHFNLDIYLYKTLEEMSSIFNDEEFNELMDFSLEENNFRPFAGDLRWIKSYDISNNPEFYKNLYHKICEDPANAMHLLNRYDEIAYLINNDDFLKEIMQKAAENIALLAPRDCLEKADIWIPALGDDKKAIWKILEMARTHKTYHKIQDVYNENEYKWEHLFPKTTMDLKKFTNDFADKMKHAIKRTLVVTDKLFTGTTLYNQWFSNAAIKTNYKHSGFKDKSSNPDVIKEGIYEDGGVAQIKIFYPGYKANQSDVPQEIKNAHSHVKCNG